MNLQEFAALVTGDKVENVGTRSGVGEVVETTAKGVRVVWGPVSGNATRFFYPVNSTAWMQWSKVEPARFTDCMCGRGDEPCPGPDGKPACFVNETLRA